MAETMQLDKPLPVGSEGKRSGGWWGILALIVTEGSLFGYLLFTYFYLASQTEQHWPPEGLTTLVMPGVNTFIFIARCVLVCVW
jgi:cytochrome c oxidase subunit 3